MKNVEFLDATQSTPMARPAPSMAGPRWFGSRWRTTRWSVVLAAASEGEQARDALATLYRVYFVPLVWFIARRRGHEAATELAQDFFSERMVAAGDLKGFEQRPGVPFRAWLFKALRNFLKNELRFARRKCRDVRKTVAWQSDGDSDRDSSVSAIPLAAPRGDGDGDIDRDSSVSAIPPAAPDHDQEQQLARKRALQLLSDVLVRLRKEYCERAAISGVDSAARFEAIKVFLPGPHTEEAEYANCAAALGMTTDAVKHLVKRQRERFKALLNETLDPHGRGGGGAAARGRRALYQALELPPREVA